MLESILEKSNVDSVIFGISSYTDGSKIIYSESFVGSISVTIALQGSPNPNKIK
jgi:hypothetical protein